jgi:hypothetical protein
MKSKVNKKATDGREAEANIHLQFDGPSAGKQVIHTVGEQNSRHNRQLIQRDEQPAFLGRRNFCDVEGRQSRRYSNGDAAYKACYGKLDQIPRESRTDRRQREEGCRAQQNAFSSEAVTGKGGHTGADDAPQEQAAGGNLGLRIGQSELLFDEDDCAVNYCRVEAEQQTTEGGYHGRQVNRARGALLCLSVCDWIHWMILLLEAQTHRSGRSFRSQWFVHYTDLVQFYWAI